MICDLCRKPWVPWKGGGPNQSRMRTREAQASYGTASARQRPSVVRRVTVVIVVVVFPRSQQVPKRKWGVWRSHGHVRTRNKPPWPRLQAAAGPTLLVPAHRPLQVSRQMTVHSPPLPRTRRFGDVGSRGLAGQKDARLRCGGGERRHPARSEPQRAVESIRVPNHRRLGVRPFPAEDRLAVACRRS